MPKLKYSHKVPEERQVARAIGRELKVSPKKCLEICREIRGKNLNEAKEYLQRVTELKEAVPFKRHNKKIAHRRGLQKWDAGRYPKKAAARMLEILENAQANAEYKGMDVERLFVGHISAKRGRVFRGIRPRAMGRATAHNTLTTNLDVILEER